MKQIFHQSTFPIQTLGLIIVVWVGLAALNLMLKQAGLVQGTPSYFPISVFSGPTLHLAGIPYGLVFLSTLLLVTIHAARLPGALVVGAGVLLLVAGNLSQGGWHDAFLEPFYGRGWQYYHDAIKIDSWRQWLSAFNTRQPSLLLHSQTHPPFAVLVHYAPLHLTSNNVAMTSAFFCAVSSLSFGLMYGIFRKLSLPADRTNTLTLLFCVLPAINIYCAVSLDGLVLTFATLFLYGLVSARIDGRITAVSFATMTIGVVLANMLTFAAVFFFGVLFINAALQWFDQRRLDLAIAAMIVIVAFTAVCVGLDLVLGYNHYRGFVTAAAIENPLGFRGWSHPIDYLVTRAEGACELLLFLSLGLLAYLFHPQRIGVGSWRRHWRGTPFNIMVAGGVTMMALLLAGAYRTGETARAAMFIYPYVMLALVRAKVSTLKAITLVAGFQTAAMQLFGSYFW